MPKIAVIVRCFNEEAHIGRLLTGLIQQSEKDIEIIVVDSGSTDATLSIASRFPVKILHIDPDNFSFGRSLNVGCAAASADYLVFASAHVYPVYEDWLETLCNPFTDDAVALVYGKQRGNVTTKYSEQQIFVKWYPENSDLNQVSYFCNNANSAIRRALWESYPFDEELTGLEDIAWAKKQQSLGRKIAYQADATVIHVHEEGYQQIYNRYRREALALKKIAPEESINGVDCIRFWLGNIYSDLMHAFQERSLLRNLVNIVSFRAAQFYGVYRARRQTGPITASVKHRLYYPKSTAADNESQEKEIRQRVRYSN